MAYTPNTEARIASYQASINSLQKNLAAYQDNLQLMKAARADLTNKKGEYEYTFQAVNSCPNQILTMDALGLTGVASIQKAVDSAYKGAKEKRFSNAAENISKTLNTKIASEEARIQACNTSIRRAQDALNALLRG